MSLYNSHSDSPSPLYHTAFHVPVKSAGPTYTETKDAIIRAHLYVQTVFTALQPFLFVKSGRDTFADFKCEITPLPNLQPTSTPREDKDKLPQNCQREKRKKPQEEPVSERPRPPYHRTPTSSPITDTPCPPRLDHSSPCHPDEDPPLLSHGRYSGFKEGV